MATKLDNLLYRRTWHNFHVEYYEGYRPNMTDFHMHEYYEISLILSGKIKVLLFDRAQYGTECRLVLTRPNTPHFITCEHDVLYRRLNVLFANDFITDYIPEWKDLISVFGKNGKILILSPEQCDSFRSLMEQMQKETKPLRQRLMLMYLLSLISDCDANENAPPSDIPHYVTGALAYISQHYAEKILASDLAWKLGIGRTTLMTAFKKYTGNTLNDYITRCRLKHAVRMLRAGKTSQESAEASGFGDTCGLIRAFKRIYNMTPGQFLAAKNP